MNREQRLVALADLRDRDPALNELIDRYGPPPLRPRVPVARRFDALARSILYQQLAGKAASAIHGRFVAALDGSVTAASVLAAPPGLLLSCGLSRAKAAAIVGKDKNAALIHAAPREATRNLRGGLIVDCSRPHCAGSNDHKYPWR